MAKVQFCKSETVETKHAPDGRGSSRVFHPGGDGALQLFEVTVQPDLDVESHAHTESEIIYVLEGQVSFGNTVLRPGDSVQIDGMTLYAFKSGPQGARYLNFRPRQDHTFFSRDEFNELKKLDPAGQAALTERLTQIRLKEFGWVKD